MSYTYRPFGRTGRPWFRITQRDMRSDNKYRAASGLPPRWINHAGNIQ